VTSDIGAAGSHPSDFDTRLSLGWYESIFASYLARKVSVIYCLHPTCLTILQPVKVVTSMGQYQCGSLLAILMVFQGSNLWEKAICWIILWIRLLLGQ
jgi:hypothetical protein